MFCVSGWIRRKRTTSCFTPGRLDIISRTLKYLRHRLGLFRRTRNPVIAQQQVETVIKEFEKELEKGQIEGYGRRLLHRHFRSHLDL
jgi:hypothetical protein